MKKRFLIILTATLLLTSCASKDTTSELNATKAVSETTEAASTTESEYQPLSEDEYNYLSEKIKLASYEDECGKALGSIGFSAIADMALESVEISSDGNIDEVLLVTDTNGKKVRMSCLYISLVDYWTVSSISNPAKDKYYWVPDGSEKYFDLYDYATDKLISEKSEDYNIDNALNEYYEEMNDISDDFDESLDEIKAKYGLD